MKQVYASGLLPKQPKDPKTGWRKSRGFVMNKAYVFEIRTGRHDYDQEVIVVAFHSSQTRKGGHTFASTEVALNRNEAEELLVGLLAAMNHDEGAST